MDALWEIAPLATWAVVGMAACLLLAGFVLLSHALLRRRAREDPWSGPLHGGRLETSVRLGLGTLLGGLALWSWELRAEGWVLSLVTAGALIAVALDAVARSRRT